MLRTQSHHRNIRGRGNNRSLDKNWRGMRMGEEISEEIDFEGLREKELMKEELR
jgi:hypothetical protein